MSDNKEQKALHELASLFDIKYFEKKKEEQAKLKVFENLLKTEPKPVEEIKEQVQPVVEEVKNTVTVEIPSPEDQVAKIADYIASQKKVNEAMYPTPIPQGNKDLNDALRKISNLEQWVSRIAAHGPGSGEVNFRYLDDVDRSTIAEGRHLAYNANTGMFFFEDVVSGEPQVQSDWTETNSGLIAFIKNKPDLANVATSGDYNDLSNTLVDDNSTTEISNNVVSVINLPANTVIGPIDQLRFDLTHTHEEERVEGTLCWDPADRTLNLAHANGVVQQVGQEQYYNVRNLTGNTITNGTCVRFSGAQMNGTSRILVEPFLADGTYPNLFVLGVATQDIANNTDGFVTSFGKVRDLDTTGNTVSEVWSLGDILYAHPTIAGKLTNVKPTAPQNVNPTAAVLRVDTTEGEIFVRPTFEQKQSYGQFMKTTDQVAPNTNFGHTMTFTDTLISNGVTIGTPNTQIVVAESGLFQFDASIQFTSGNSSTKDARVWWRINGTNVANSTRIVSNRISNGYTPIQMTQTFSLQANDYVELIFAVTDTGLYPHSAPSNAYSPDAPAVLLAVNQIQL